jgi:hypothetical protein
MKRSKLSALRKRLTQLFEERADCERIAMAAPPMVAGAFLERTVRPDQPRPYCYLSASIHGESRHRYVPVSQAHTWRRRAQRWQQFSRAMTRWVKINQEIEQLLRTLGRERCVPLPKGAARRPAKRRRRGKR